MESLTNLFFKQKGCLKVLFWIGIFLFLYLFFTVIHPIVIYDSDDWNNISYVREALPLWKDWNPCRVFPETFLPLVSYVAAYLVNPLIHDYISSMTLTHGFVISMTILIYLYLFGKWIKAKFAATDAQTLICISAFLLFHFSILKGEWENNSYLFFSENITCYFYYVLPNLINAILVLWFMNNGTDINKIWKSKHLLKKGFFILLVYLAVLSNLFQTIILISFLGFDLLISFFSFVKEKRKSLILFFKEKSLSILIITFWLISLVFEASGERSSSIASENLQIKDSILTLIAYLPQLNRRTCFLFFVAVTVAFVIWIRSKNSRAIDRSYIRIVLMSFVCAAIVAVFLILLCAVSGSGYLARADVSFGIFFYGFLLIMGSIMYVLQNHPRITLGVPLILYIILMNTMIGGQIFKESNMGGISSKICVAVDNDLINQLVTADKEGKTEVVLHVPIGNGTTDDNWPHAEYMGYTMSRTLCRHGVISRIMDVTVKPDPELNKKYHIKY